MGWRRDNEVQQMLRESAQGHLASKGGADHFRSVRDSEAGFEPEAWAAMAELGWTGILLPETVGGSELGLEVALTVAEEIGRSISPEPFASAAVIAATLLGEAASASATASALAGQLAAGEAVPTLAWQEKRNAVAPSTFETVLNAGKLAGTKLFVPGWTGNSHLLVAARDGADAQTVILVLEPGAEGVSADTQRMTDGTFTATLEFSGTPVSDDAILLRGEAADAALKLALARGTLAVSAQLEGLASALWDITGDYLKQRVQFDQPIADFQAVRHRLVDLHAQIELAGASWRKGLSLLEAGRIDDPAIHAAKARCSDAAMDMGRWAVQFHGAMGYTEEANVGLYLNTALRWSSWLGNANAHRRRAFALSQGRD